MACETMSFTNWALGLPVANAPYDASGAPQQICLLGIVGRTGCCMVAAFRYVPITDPAVPACELARANGLVLLRGGDMMVPIPLGVEFEELDWQWVTVVGKEIRT